MWEISPPLSEPRGWGGQWYSLLWGPFITQMIRYVFSGSHVSLKVFVSHQFLPVPSITFIFTVSFSFSQKCLVCISFSLTLFCGCYLSGERISSLWQFHILWPHLAGSSSDHLVPGEGVDWASVVLFTQTSVSAFHVWTQDVQTWRCRPRKGRWRYLWVNNRKQTLPLAVTPLFPCLSDM